MKQKKQCEIQRIKITGTYTIHIQGDDWGCGVDKVILDLSHMVDKVDAKDFVVRETKKIMNRESGNLVETTVERIVTSAYLCDEEGNKMNIPSSFVVLELYISPTEGSPLVFSMETYTNIWSDPYYLTIDLAKDAKLASEGKFVDSFMIDTEIKGRTTNADMFTMDMFSAMDGVSYQYASFAPVSMQKVKTLIVWLHGLGEGGTENTDPYITLLGAKVTALTGKKFQSILGGAHVLVPQCPTFWMDKSGRGNLNNGKIEADGTSFYTESLYELIQNYKDKVGAEKVIITGCSNGGYMALVMAMAYPDEYDACVPICEAVPEKCIADAQLECIKDLPLYFIYSEDDTTVDPELHEIPVIERLKKLGASNLHVAVTKNVTDTTGRFWEKDGSAYSYNGHWSWIYFFNNESICIEYGESVWQWMAEQLK